MALEETSSITGRWFVDSEAPFASDDLTREIRDVDMLPTDELDEKLLGAGLAYRDVRLGGARLLPSETPVLAEDDYTDSFEVEDPFEPSGSSVELPQNWAGALHARIAGHVERLLELCENARPRLRGTTAALTLAATLTTVVVGVIVGAAAIGSSVRADDPGVAPKSVVVQQRALSQFAVEWATSHRANDMTFTVDEVSAEPEPEVSAAERRRIARAERAERRREARRRRARRR